MLKLVRQAAAGLRRRRGTGGRPMGGDVLWLGLHKTGTTFLQKSLDL